MTYITFGEPIKSSSATTGEIYTRPPVAFPQEGSESFIKALLGRDGYGLTIEDLGVENDATVFRVTSTGYDDEHYWRRQLRREQAFHTIAARILRIVDFPSVQADMLEENPFPVPISEGK